MNDYTNDEIVFITDSTMCSNLNPMIPCPIRDSEGNIDYSYYMDSKGVKDVDWKIAVGASDSECERNWAFINKDGSINTDNVPYTITDGNGTWCKKKIKFSKNQLMKAWNRAGCISDFPTTANTTGWQNLNSIADVQTNMSTYWKNSKDINYIKQCYGFDFIKADNTPLSSGVFLTSPNGLYTAKLQADGNLVIIKSGIIILFAILAVDQTMAGGKLTFQTDGNLVLYRTNGSPYWNSATSGPNNPGNNYVLTLRDNGNLCIYDISGTDIKLIWKISSASMPNLRPIGQEYGILKNTIIKNLKNASYQKMSNSTFDPNNKLNSEDGLFLTLLNKSINYCNDKDIKDPYCSTFYNNATNKINNDILNNYYLKK